MKLSMFRPKFFLATAAESLTNKMALDRLECSTQKLCQRAAASPTEKEISVCDDVPLIEGLIAGKTDTEACGLLRQMVLDLMQEVDEYRGRLEEKEKRVTTLEEERIANSQEARDRLFSLMLALQKVTGDAVRVKLEPTKMFSNEEATDLVVSELTKKIGKLNMENTKLLERVNEMRESMDDLEGENESSLYKIEALEIQFKSINMTRQTVVSGLVDRSKHSTVQISPRAHGRHLECV
jgi:chromosome segregation ATPase